MTLYAEKPHILVVDDDDRIRDLVCRYLSERGFITLPAEDAVMARAVLERFDIDAAVVDIMMPGETGLELTESLRAKKRLKNFPIILLTAMGEAKDRIAGLQAGADDYLPKPFEPEELVLRLQAILRRVPEKPEQAVRYRIGPWIFDPLEKTLEMDEQKVTLSDIEVSLIQALAKQSGQAMDREKLAEQCDVQAGERTIDVQITRLRKKFEADTKAPQYLQTVRGHGYLLRAEPIEGNGT